MNNTGKRLIAVIIIVILAIVGYEYLITPQHRTLGQKLDAAADALPNGVDKAADQLHDRTPGEDLGDAVKDTGQKIKDKTGND